MTAEKNPSQDADKNADIDESAGENSVALDASKDEVPAKSVSSSTESRSPVVRIRRFSRKRVCPLSVDGAPAVDYKDLSLLQRYISERGKIIPARLSGVSRKKQRELAAAVKRARYLALLPYIAR